VTGIFFRRSNVVKRAPKDPMKLQACVHRLKILKISPVHRNIDGWPLVPEFAVSNPAEAVGFFRCKNPQHAFLWRGS
jgi:hypothetical protein